MTETPPRRLAARPKGLSANIGATLTQPISLFRSLVEAPQRQWLTIALIVLILVGLAAVRFDARLRESAAGGIATEGGVPISPSGGGGVPPPGGGGGGVPPPSGGGGDLGGGGTAPPTTADVGTVWTTALLAGTRLALMWGGMAILLSLVSLLQGRAPDMALNLHVAIWSSLPLGVMALLQIIYYGMGGAVG
ncbi:MAG TPA: hypothetical protein PLD47_17410, partial [Aggregatilineales bacterium]|nr:hypothetical protein [Aggregatilineales bacterium]